MRWHVYHGVSAEFGIISWGIICTSHPIPADCHRVSLDCLLLTLNRGLKESVDCQKENCSLNVCMCGTWKMNWRFSRLEKKLWSSCVEPLSRSDADISKFPTGCLPSEGCECHVMLLPHTQIALIAIIVPISDFSILEMCSPVQFVHFIG